MKILIDQNISFRIIARIQHEFPQIEHVKTLGLKNANDYDIFKFARSNSFNAIFTLDEDFYHLQLVHGIPPKIIWLRVGNCSTAHLAQTILHNLPIIKSFISDPLLECLEIF